MKLGELAPSLVTYLEAAATHGCQGNGPSDEAFKVLEKALETLTNPCNTAIGNELSAGFLEILDNLFKKKGKKPVTEAMVNVAITNHVLLNITSGYAILNKDHSRNLMNGRRVFLPQNFGFAGLALGK